MTQSNNSHQYHPRITFQDTNIVGNVYFLTFFRWQAECRDEWIRKTRPDLWKEMRGAATPLVVTHWSTRFDDPIGATVGDDVCVTMEFDETDDEISTSTVFARPTPSGTESIGSGQMRYSMSNCLPLAKNDLPQGPCYEFTASSPREFELNPLDLLAWQGKCRELFLADHAPQSLQLVAHRELALQTTSASIDLLQIPAFPLQEIRVELRLETLKCGQMGVRFDYYSHSAEGVESRIAKRQQRMSSKRFTNTGLAPSSLPTDILFALRRFTNSEHLPGKIADILDFAETTNRGPTVDVVQQLTLTPSPSLVLSLTNQAD